MRTERTDRALIKKTAGNFQHIKVPDLLQVNTDQMYFGDIFLPMLCPGIAIINEVFSFYVAAIVPLYEEMKDRLSYSLLFLITCNWDINMDKHFKSCQVCFLVCIKNYIMFGSFWYCLIKLQPLVQVAELIW